VTRATRDNPRNPARHAPLPPTSTGRPPVNSLSILRLPGPEFRVAEPGCTEPGPQGPVAGCLSRAWPAGGSQMPVSPRTPAVHAGAAPRRPLGRRCAVSESSDSDSEACRIASEPPRSAGPVTRRRNLKCSSCHASTRGAAAAGQADRHFDPQAWAHSSAGCGQCRARAGLVTAAAEHTTVTATADSDSSTAISVRRAPRPGPGAGPIGHRPARARRARLSRSESVALFYY
jgi:hypothetical protein